METKSLPKVTSTPSDLPQYDEAERTGATGVDAKDMYRMGKKQEFSRNFSFWSVLGFVSVLTATWEYVLTSLSVGFSSGGYAGLFWCFIVTVICYSTVILSLAEMASMAPTCGGQYHWTSEFAPPSFQRVLSYASGWMSTLAWIAGVASTYFICVAQVQAMMNVYHPSFAFTQWQYTLTLIAFAMVTIVFVTWGSRALPQIEIWSLVLHAGGFTLIMVAILVLTPKNSAHEVFLDFRDSSGWNNLGVAFMVSQVYVLFCNAGTDSIVHISEEVEDASWIVPRCMWWSYLVNVVLGIAMLVAMLFCLGPLDQVLQTDTPYLVLFNNTGSKGLSMTMNLTIFLLTYIGNVNSLPAGSREVFAFARDKGLPFSSWIGRIDPRRNVPFNSAYVVTIGCILLSCINFGSTIGFTIIISVGLLALLSTYLISIGCVLWRRLKRRPLPPARWSLGRRGLPINLFALVYSGWLILWCCFPPNLPVGAASANYSPLVWVAVAIISLVWYVAYGKRHYTAPVEFVEGRKARGVGLQSSD